MTTTVKSYNFLQGGGEMGEITREFDWSQTPIGWPDEWPQSLRTTVSVVLNSAFPMFLFWGDELISFYNDAFRPSLGIDGKHPATGKRAKDIWPEIWDFIGPLIDQVMTTGEPVWFEDQLVPFYRNGKMEDIYWTFSYSPAYKDDGSVNGVFVVCTETTSKVKNLQKLQESEVRFRSLISESATATAVLTGPELIIEVANDAILKLWYKDSSIIGKPLLEIMPEQQDQRYYALMQKVLATGETVHEEAAEVNLMRDGQMHRVYRDFSYKALYNDIGGVQSILVTVTDVTDKLEAQQKLIESEQRVLAVVENAPFAIAVYTGKEMKVTLANQAIMDIWGKGYDVIGKLFTEVLPELGSQEVFDQIRSVYNSGISYHTRNQRLDLVVNGKSRPFWFNYSLTPLFDTAGNVYGVMNTGVDITDLNIAKMKVEENEKNMRNTILKAPVAMCIFRGPQHVVEIANERMIELWGKTAAEVMNKPIFEGLPEAKDQGFEQLLDGVFNTGEAFVAQDVPITLPRNGKAEQVYVNFVYEAFREAEGNISGIIAVATDSTDQVIARQKIQDVVAERTKELAEANTNLQKSNAELAQFAYIASHDLQEPVRKVSTFAQMLEQSLGNIDDRSKRYLDKITAASSRMTSLIRDVLSYSQLSKEKEVFQPVDLQHLVENIKGDFELLIEQKRATIDHDNLPTINAIPLQMAQLFGNLISNALKFSREGVAPVINISTALLSASQKTQYGVITAGDWYNITVSDNGIGFKQEYAEQIFNIFQRLHGKAEYSGTGIGLAMCKKIAQNHNGDIYASSSPGSGAVFNIILPAHND